MINVEDGPKENCTDKEEKLCHKIVEKEILNEDLPSSTRKENKIEKESTINIRYNNQENICERITSEQEMKIGHFDISLGAKDVADHVVSDEDILCSTVHNTTHEEKKTPSSTEMPEVLDKAKDKLEFQSYDDIYFKLKDVNIKDDNAQQQEDPIRKTRKSLNSKSFSSLLTVDDYLPVPEYVVVRKEKNKCSIFHQILRKIGRCYSAAGCVYEPARRMVCMGSPREVD